MTKPSTQGERLARIEAILEALPEALGRNGEAAAAVSQKLDEMDARWTQRFDALEKELSDDKADLAALKNKGAGILIGVGLAGSALGAAALAVADRFLDFFK